MRVTTISGSVLECCGIGSVDVEASSGQRAALQTVVVNRRPLGVDMVLGVRGISALGGVTVLSPTEVRFCGAVSRVPLSVDAPDFSVCFDAAERKWTVGWKWSDGVGPECLMNTVAEYVVPPAARHEYEAELDTWIEQGWLVPYDEDRHGAARGLVPLMAVQQSNKAKVRPVMDYRELNGFVTAHTADTDVCADQLRRWRRHGSNVAVVDLKRAYLQLHVEERLWPFQTVMIRGQRYCLTRLGFGLNIAPLVMKAVVRSVLEQDSDVQRATLPYVDDLLVNEDVLSAERVVAHFAKFGLDCKPPERAASGARLLGLHVQAEGEKLRWTRDNAVGGPPARVTRRAVFAWCGRLVAHLPVCGWLRPAVAWLKRRVNRLTQTWDDVTDDATLRAQMDYVAVRLLGEDPARGAWCVEGESLVVWTDASSLATGVVVQSADGDVIEDACWLRRDEATHINMAELDAAIRGVNLAVAWGARTIDLRTDSATVHRWLDDAISGRARLRTKAHGELLIRRRVEIICQLVNELQLRLSVVLVRSSENRADALTRVPKDWLREVSGAPARALSPDGVSAAAVGEPPQHGASGVTVAVPPPPPGDSAARADGGAGPPPPPPPPGDSAVRADGSAGNVTDAVREAHERAGHPGFRRTLYFARRDVSRGITRATAQAVVRSCDVCRSIDPAPVRWRHGTLGVATTWQRIAIDVTHHHGHGYLSIIDCGPSRFCVWRPLRRPGAAEVVRHLEQIFLERGAPEEILADNDTMFRGRQVAALAARWRVTLRFRAVHEPGGNGVVERCHRSIKVIAARRQCTVAEAVHLYNVTPRDGDTAESTPASGVYRYSVRDCVRPVATDAVEAGEPPPTVSDGERLRVGDRVWMRPRGTRCTETSRRGTVTGIVSRQVVEVDGVPWHVRDVRRRCERDGDGDANSVSVESVDDEPPMYVPSADVPEAESGGSAAGDAPEPAARALGPSLEPADRIAEPSGDETAPAGGELAPLRRSTRARKATDFYCCAD